MADQKRKRKKYYKKPGDVRRLLSDQINDVRNDDELTTDQKAQRITTLSNSILRAMEQGELTDRMDKYEKELAEYKAIIERDR